MGVEGLCAEEGQVVVAAFESFPTSTANPETGEPS
jgi:hypothetical protein